jgi:hypothetical protein
MATFGRSSPELSATGKDMKRGRHEDREARRRAVSRQPQTEERNKAEQIMSKPMNKTSAILRPDGAAK